MASATAGLSLLSTGDLAGHFGVPEAVIRRCLDRIGLGKRIGQYRVISAEDLERVEIGLLAAGYLTPTPGERRAQVAGVDA